MAQQRYHVIERIDAGGMAEVFKANSTSLQGFEKLVAIKRILPKLAKNERFVRMFLDEAKLSLHLSHTNCVQVFDLGLADGTYFIVMEFVDGVNLKHIIEESRRKKQAFPVEQAVYVALEICKGLAHAHEKTDQKGGHLAIVHRDISPPNILISREGEVKITDFGLAKAKSQVETTDPGVVKGKFGYLSPEAAQGEEVDARTDIFAIGILLWEMLTGTRLFLGDTDLDTLQQVRTNAVPSLAKYRDDVPHELEKIIKKALATDTAKRYQKVKRLGQDLAEFLFSYGEPVTSFDISNWVTRIRKKQPQPSRSERDRAVEDAVQEAVNRIVTLEEIDDLDRFMADQYESFPDQGAGLDIPVGGDFVDPRMWADMGFADMDLSVKDPDNSDAWEERNVNELIRKRQESSTKTKPVPKEGEGTPPPPMPDDRTIELADIEGKIRDDALRRAREMDLDSHVPSFRDSSHPAPQEPDDATLPDATPYGPQRIQPVSDSVSQAMARVQQQATRSSGEQQTPAPTPGSDKKPKKSASTEQGGKAPVGTILFVVILLAAIVAGIFFSGVI